MNPVPPPPPPSPYGGIERFKLVQIAFDRALAKLANPDVPGCSSVAIAKEVVLYADDVLAEMKKKPEAENDDAK